MLKDDIKITRHFGSENLETIIKKIISRKIGGSMWPKLAEDNASGSTSDYFNVLYQDSWSNQHE